MFSVQEFIDILNFIGRAGGVIAILIAFLGFAFREKWKQLLQRSLSVDLERLKGELAKEQAEHAASLTPQLEAIRHDFQQKIEAYKVSLIAETEAVKARSDLRKSIAIRYSEIEFERLISLEKHMASLPGEVLGRACLPTDQKSSIHFDEAFEAHLKFSSALQEAQMFVEPDLNIKLSELAVKAISIISDYVGPGKPKLEFTDNEQVDLLRAASAMHTLITNQIRALAKI